MWVICMEKKFNRFFIVFFFILLIILLWLTWYGKKQKAVREDKELAVAFDQVGDDMLTAENWQKLRCIPRDRLDCEGVNCTKSQPVVYLILDRQSKTFSRCDKKGCDVYDAIFRLSGMFTNIQPINPNGTMIKVLGNREYIEVVTTGLGVIFQNGNCSEIQ